MVQENCPEDAALKRRVLADIDAATPPEVVIASSTSGFAMTMLQADCANRSGAWSGIRSTRPT